MIGFHDIILKNVSIFSQKAENQPLTFLQTGNRLKPQFRLQTNF